MSKENHQHPAALKGEIQAILEDRLGKYVEQVRSLRAKRLKQFGFIDQWRIVRDQAVILSKLNKHAQTLMLSAALDRLAQMPDFVPASDLEALLNLDYDPEGENTNE